MELGLEEAISISEKTDELETTVHEDLLQETSVDSEEQTSSAATSQSTNDLQEYQFTNSDSSQVAYRVVQVGSNDNQQATLSIVTTNGIIANNNDNQQVHIVASPFNGDSGNEGGGNSNNEGEATRFTYFPSSAGTSIPSPTSTNSNITQTQAEQNVLSGGQFYVMMSPQDVMQTGQGVRTLVARSPFSQKDGAGRGENRDFSRRVQHNEVERRRRDKINTWISKLATLVPDCANDHTKQGQSKGGILSKACDHIVDLQSTNQELMGTCKNFERLQIDNELMKQQLDDAKQKIELLTHTLRVNGIEVQIQNKSQ